MNDSTDRRARSSRTDPLRIDEVSAGDAGGLIGVTFCPGKNDPSGDWARDLEADLDVVQAWGPRAMITLIEDHEFQMLGVPGLGIGVRARGIDWHHLPIVDLQAPDERFETAWLSIGPALCNLLRDGGKVLVHCRGGCGRAGTIAARLLVDLGVAPRDAVERVRAARPCAIEMPEQMRYVLGLPGGLGAGA